MAFQWTRNEIDLVSMTCLVEAPWFRLYFVVWTQKKMGAVIQSREAFTYKGFDHCICLRTMPAFCRAFLMLPFGVAVCASGIFTVCLHSVWAFSVYGGTWFVLKKRASRKWARLSQYEYKPFRAVQCCVAHLAWERLFFLQRVQTCEKDIWGYLRWIQWACCRTCLLPFSLEHLTFSAACSGTRLAIVAFKTCLCIA